MGKTRRQREAAEAASRHQTHRRVAWAATACVALIAVAAAAPEGREARALLPFWPASSSSQRLEPATLPACDYLAGALELGMAGPESGVATGLSQLTTRLRWTYGYPPNPRYP